MAKISPAKINKYDVLVKKLEDNQQVWQAIGALQNSVNEIKSLLAHLQPPAGEKKPRGRAKRSDEEVQNANMKKDRRNSLNKKTVTLAGSLYAFAIETKNEDIKTIAFLNHNKMENKNDKQAILVGAEVLESAKANVDKLAYYGVTAEELVALGSAIEDFKQVAGRRKLQGNDEEDEQPKVKISATKILKDIDDILEERVDKLLLRFEDSHPDFYKSYNRTRNSLKGKSKRVVAVVATDAAPQDENKPRRGRPRRQPEAV
ncbi:MAG: hypothetical protein EAZ95_09980 [Bacteroidetes bacterium]|nr:MAG: hypothetical protein EAZ95_09980 [Bacteroidota bacterium]